MPGKQQLPGRRECRRVGQLLHGRAAAFRGVARLHPAHPLGSALHRGGEVHQLPGSRWFTPHPSHSSPHHDLCDPYDLSLQCPTCAPRTHMHVPAVAWLPSFVCCSFLCPLVLWPPHIYSCAHSCFGCHRFSVQSLLRTVCPDDILQYHWPLLGVTLTRPILYLAGYMGGVGRHAGGLRCCVDGGVATWEVWGAMQVGFGAVWLEGWLHGRYGALSWWAPALCGWRGGYMGGVGYHAGGLQCCVAGGGGLARGL